MKENKVRIEYRIQKENDELKLAFELEEKEALEIFQKLFDTYKKRGKENSLEIKEEKERKIEKKKKEIELKKEVEQKEEAEPRGKETIYKKVLNFVAENGNVTAKEVANGIGAKQLTVSMYLNKMKASGEIINPDGIATKYCINTKSNQLPIEEKKQPENQEQGTFEKLISNEKYSEIMEYIMKKNSFKMDSVREKFQQYDESIPHVIKSLADKELISFKDETDEYVVPEVTRVWYVLLKEKSPVQDVYISYKLGIKIDKDFIKVLQIATKQGLIEEVKKNGRVCYKAKLK